MTVTIPSWLLWTIGIYLLLGVWSSWTVWRDRWQIWWQLVVGIIIWPYLLVQVLGDEQFWALRRQRKNRT